MSKLEHHLFGRPIGVPQALKYLSICTQSFSGHTYKPSTSQVRATYISLRLTILHSFFNDVPWGAVQASRDIVVVHFRQFNFESTKTQRNSWDKTCILQGLPLDWESFGRVKKAGQSTVLDAGEEKQTAPLEARGEGRRTRDAIEKM